jgi:threonine/homoserine/homoserine lactone efflux protein
MPKLLRIFFTGMFISFLGSLPLGTLNIAAMQLAISDGVVKAIYFSLGCLTIEMIYVRLSLIAMDWVRKQRKLFLLLEWLTLAIVVTLALASWYAALHPTVHKNPVLSSMFPSYILGLMMSALNPVQIPFWFGWSTVLYTKGVLVPKANNYNTYIIGIGFGTLLGSCVFIFGGRLVAGSIRTNQSTLNLVIGIIFSITAGIQLYKILKKKDAEHQLEHPEEVEQKFEHQLRSIKRKSKA